MRGRSEGQGWKGGQITSCGLESEKIKIGIWLEGFVKESFEEFLKANIDVMTYNTTMILVVDPNTMVHHLNIKEDYKLDKQKKHPFTPDRQESIREEIVTLTHTGFISKMMNLIWLANVVLVKKANGK